MVFQDTLAVLLSTTVSRRLFPTSFFESKNTASDFVIASCLITLLRRPAKHVNSEDNLREHSEEATAFTRISILVLLLCASLFVVYYSNSGYSSDEVWSIKAAGLNYSSEMAMLKADVHPPLYYLLLHEWVRLFGTGERTVRGLSALFYILSVYAIYRLGRLLYGHQAALLCASLYLSSPLAVLSGQFARMYSLLALLSIVSIWLYLQFSLKLNNSRLLFGLYVVINVLGTFTHIAFFFVLFAQIICHFLFFREKRIKSFIAAIALSLIPYTLLWAPVLFRQIGNSAEGLAWLKKPGAARVLELFLVYGGAFWLLLPAILFIWWRSRAKSFRIRELKIPLWLFAVTILTPLLISQFKPIFNSRFAIIGLPLFCLAIGALVARTNTYLISIALIVLNATTLSVMHTASSSCDNRSVASYLAQTASEGDVIIFTSLTRFPIDYYLQRTQSSKQLVETSFPAEIDNHPGYEGNITDSSRRSTFEQQAGELVARISNMKQSRRDLRIFFFHGFRPEIDTLLKDPLNGRFQVVPGLGMQCIGTSSYFTNLSVYQ